MLAAPPRSALNAPRQKRQPATNWTSAASAHCSAYGISMSWRPLAMNAICATNGAVSSAAKAKLASSRR